MKKCPFCAEQIQDEAIVCRFCNRDLPEETPAQKVRREKLALLEELRSGNESLRRKLDAVSQPSHVGVVAWLGILLGALAIAISVAVGFDLYNEPLGFLLGIAAVVLGILSLVVGRKGMARVGLVVAFVAVLSPILMRIGQLDA